MIISYKPPNNMKIKNFFQLGVLSILLVFTACKEQNQEPKKTTPAPNSVPKTKAPASKPVPDGYHRVSAGETLFDVAKEHNISVDELKDLNPKLADDPTTWNVGIEVRVKPEEKKKKKPKDIASKPQSPTTTSSFDESSDSKSSWKYHKLQKGENLYRVAKKNNLSMDQLYRLNPSLKDKVDNLQIGQEVRVR